LSNVLNFTNLEIPVLKINYLISILRLIHAIIFVTFGSGVIEGILTIGLRFEKDAKVSELYYDIWEEIQDEKMERRKVVK
jgi:hypothetical protein